MSRAQRSRCMAAIGSKDTRPELLVRKFLWHQGVRYRKHVRGLPGSPDIVIRRLRTVIFVHGCFWHGHEGCYREPATNTGFWRAKVQRNRQRDAQVRERLTRLGWQVITIWECELTARRRDDTLSQLLRRLLSPARYAEPELQVHTAAEPPAGYATHDELHETY